MNIHSLPQNSALTPGSELWVVPDQENSRWSQQLDWYLNFQIARTHNKKPMEVPSTIKHILEEEEIEFPFGELKENSPLLIVSSQALPNSQFVELPYLKRKSSWIKKIHSLWLDLGKPSIRIFLLK